MVIVDGQHRLGACAHLAAITASAGGGVGGALQQDLETVTVEVPLSIPMPIGFSASMLLGATRQPLNAQQRPFTFDWQH